VASELGEEDQFEMANIDEIQEEILQYNSDSELEEVEEAEVIYKQSAVKNFKDVFLQYYQDNIEQEIEDMKV